MLLTALALGAAAPLRLPPVDECAKDPSFVEFRTSLRQIIERRDRSSLIAILAGDFWSGRPAVGADRDRFVANWTAKQDGAWSWNELRTILDLGCVLYGGRAHSPSFAYQLPDRYESFTSTLARPGAVVRSRPNDRSRVVAKSSWLLLTELEQADGDWIGVQLSNGRKGYIKQDMMAGTGVTLSFEKRDGRWVMTGWTSGD
jgi:hypothetical protein